MTNNPPSLDPQRLLVMRTLLVFTIFGCLLFGGLNISRGVYPLAVIEILIGGFSVWLFYWIERSPNAQRWLMLYLLLFFSTMMIAISTPEGTSTIFVWVFLIPLISHLLLGRWRGLAVSLVFLAIAAVIYFRSLETAGALGDLISIANVVLCAAVILALSFAYETAREDTEAQLQRLATTDALTGLPNRAAMEPALRRKRAEALREGSRFAVLSMDLDHFKTINDQNGHEAGDRALVTFAELLRQRVRGSDLACRWGGEEFQVLLSGTGRDGAVRIAEDVRRALEARNREADAPPFPMTVSVGVAVYPEDADTISDLLIIADRRLYRAKADGRNRVVADGAEVRYGATARA